MFFFCPPFFKGVTQDYETRVADEFVMIGNDALLKCATPSYAADYLQVIGWVTSNNIRITPNAFQDGKIVLLSEPKITDRERESFCEGAAQIVIFIIYLFYSKVVP